MRLAVLSPYGTYHQESGLLYLVANYLAKRGAEVVQLRCDGALPACGRDVKYGEGRAPFTCLRCLSEQGALAQWAGIRSRDLSTFISPQDVLESSKWMSSIARSDLERVEFRGVRLWEACGSRIQAQVGEVSPRDVTPAQEEEARSAFLSYVYSVVASERFFAAWKPTMSFVISSTDPIARAYLTHARRGETEASVFTFDPSTESIVVELLSSGATYSTALILPEVTSMRSDPRTWAPELSAIVDELLSFLGHGADLVPGVE